MKFHRGREWLSNDRRYVGHSPAESAQPLHGAYMSHIRYLTLLAIASIVISSHDLSAQQLQPTRVRGTIEKVEGNQILVKSREGSDGRIQIGEKTGVIGLKQITLADIELNAFVGVAALPQRKDRKRQFPFMSSRSLRGDSMKAHALMTSVRTVP